MAGGKSMGMDFIQDKACVPLALVFYSTLWTGAKAHRSQFWSLLLECKILDLNRFLIPRKPTGEVVMG